MKRGGGMERVDLDEIDVAIDGQTDDKLLQVNEALERFAAIDPRKATLVKLRYFAGLTFPEAAQALDIAVPTAKEWWSYARAWLSVRDGGPRNVTLVAMAGHCLSSFYKPHRTVLLSLGDVNRIRIGRRNILRFHPYLFRGDGACISR